jgi:hypothetical protein
LGTWLCCECCVGGGSCEGVRCEGVAQGSRVVGVWDLFLAFCMRWFHGLWSDEGHAR